MIGKSDKNVSYNDIEEVGILASPDGGTTFLNIKSDDEGALIIKIVDPQGNPAEVDDTTHTLQTIGYEHHEIHAGSHFNYCDYDISPLGAGDTIEFVMTVPDTTEWPHLTFDFFSSTGATVELFEGTAGVEGGTTITPRNNNRNSDHASTVTLIKDPTSITTDGTRAAGYLAGANRNAGFVSRDNENVLKRNTAYLVRITSLASSNNVSWCAEWYEHINRE